jgi:tetratricopeptide (TPR) repeat protein
VFNKLARQPDVKPAAGDPRAAVFDVFATLLDPHRKTAVFWDADLERELRVQSERFMPAVLRAGTSMRWFSDALQSLFNVELEGDAGVWRASIEADGKRNQLYFALDRGVAKLIGATNSLSGVGRYLLRGGGDARADARARRLLDWIRADNDKPARSDLLAVKRLWGPAMPSSHDAITLIAAILAGETDPDRVIAIATRCPSTLPDAELACHEALFLAYRARGRWADAVAQSEAVLAQRPDTVPGRAQIHAWALARAGRFDDADHMLDEVLAKDPDHHAARIGRFEVAGIRGSAADMIQRGDALVNHPSATPWELNYVAWYRMALGGDLTSALELARKALDKAPREGGFVNTLAAIEAEIGDPGQAIHDNWKAMGLRGVSEPGADDWYVIGRIYEQLGLTADATAAYKRVTKIKVDQLISTHAMAQRRLSAMAAAH